MPESVRVVLAAVSFLGLNPHTAVFADMGCGASTPAPDAAKSGEAPVAAKSGKTAGAAKSGKAPVAAQSAEDKQYGPVIKGHEAAIKTLFKKIDVDNDGHLIASELKRRTLSPSTRARPLTRSSSSSGLTCTALVVRPTVNWISKSLDGTSPTSVKDSTRHTRQSVA